jgi:signal transduction histidine kinase
MSLISINKPTKTLAEASLFGGSVDVRMIAVMRCILSFSGLVIAYVDPTQPAIFSALTYSSLIIYGVWSAVLAIMAFLRDPAAAPPRHTHWGDVLFCAYLVTLTQGTNSLFFSFFLFAILSASFSRGYKEGLLVTGASVILFILASLWFEPGAKFGFDQTLVRPIYLFTLGYMISYWGGHEITQRLRMKMLQEVNSQSNPRYGYDHAIRANLERILNFFEASECILVLRRPTIPPTYISYKVSHQQHEQDNQEAAANADSDNQKLLNLNVINEEAAKVLLDLPDTFSYYYDKAPAWWKKYFPGAYPPLSDVSLAETCRVLANLLGTNCFMTVPYIQQDGSDGRLFIVPGNQTFSHSDVEFVRQMVMSISRVVGSMLLMDELVSESAKHERFRISMDIHDTTIQPYIGLKLGLDALNRQAGSGNPLSKDISELLSMTEATIGDLRGYVKTLREDRVLAGDSLIASIKEQVDHFKRFYGIDVTVKCDAKIELNSRLAGAVLQFFAEGLSNILRHTEAKHAYFFICSENNKLLLEIGNESSDNKCKDDFVPRSINARARSLGGTSMVSCNKEAYTVVSINIPL